MPKRILVVEDEADNAAILRMILDSAGYTTLPAGDLASARTCILETPLPDLVILDLQLPDGSGLDFCHEVKGLSPTCPVVIVTANAEPRTKTDALATCANAYFTKPFNIEELETLLSRLLASHTPPEATA